MGLLEPKRLRGLIDALAGRLARTRLPEPVRGEPPSPLNPPSGCAYHTRCPHATEICRQERPVLRALQGTQVACHHAEAVA